MFYIYQNTAPKSSWVFGSSIHDTAPAGSISRKFVSGTTFRFIYNQVSGVTPIGLEVDILTVGKNANGDLYASVSEFETACDSFFVKASTGGGGVTPEQLALKADKLSTAFTIKANPTENDADEQEYDCDPFGLGLLAYATKHQVIYYIGTSNLVKSTNMSGAGATVQLADDDTCDDIVYYLYNIGASHTVKLPLVNRYKKITVQCYFANTTDNNVITIKDASNYTITTFTSGKINGANGGNFPYVICYCTNGGYFDTFIEQNVIGDALSQAKTKEQARQMLEVSKVPYFVDLDFPIIVRNTGVGIPTLETLIGNVTAPQWQVNDFNVCEGQELIHG